MGTQAASISHIYPVDFLQRYKSNLMKEKYWFSTNGSGAIGHPQAKTNEQKER